MSINSLPDNPIILSELGTVLGPYLNISGGITMLTSPDGNLDVSVAGNIGKISLYPTIHTTGLNTFNLNVSLGFLVHGQVGTSGQVLISQGSSTIPPVWSSVGAANIAAGSITDVQISPTAGIELSKLQTLAPGNIIVGSSGSVPTSVVMSGGATISSTGVVTLNSGSTALNSAHIFVGNGSNIATDTNMTGDVTIDNTGVTTISPIIYKVLQTSIPANNVQVLSTAPWILINGLSNIIYNVIRWDYGVQTNGVPFTFAGGTTLNLQYTTASTNIGVVDAGFLNTAGISQVAYMATPTVANVSSDPTLAGPGVDILANLAGGLQIKASANSTTAGNSPLTIRVVYQEVPFLL